MPERQLRADRRVLGKFTLTLGLCPPYCAAWIRLTSCFREAAGSLCPEGHSSVRAFLLTKHGNLYVCSLPSARAGLGTRAREGLVGHCFRTGRGRTQVQVVRVS